MTYDRQQLRVDWTFSIDDTDEVAVTGLSVTGLSDFGAVAALALYNPATQGSALRDAMVTMLATAPFAWADYSILTGVRVAALDTAGHYLADAKVFDNTDADQGNLTQIVPQSTVVLSLRTPTTFGEANYGRMYLPHLLLPLSNGTPAATFGSAATASSLGANFIDAVNDVFNTGSEPARVANMSSKGTGTTKGVTRVAVGTINDTQRRRRNRLVETYAYSSVA